MVRPVPSIATVLTAKSTDLAVSTLEATLTIFQACLPRDAHALIPCHVSDGSCWFVAVPGG